MSTLTRRAHRKPFADVFGWLEAPLGLIRPVAGHPMQAEGTHRSEFRYGTFARTIRLPGNADEQHIQADYDSGVLEVEIRLRDADGDSRHIPVMLNHHIAPT